MVEFNNPNLSFPENKSAFEPYLHAVDKFEQKNYKDTLTGCFNQNYFENFKKENFDSERDNNDLGLVFVDVNYLKKTNDDLGHDAGDNLLKSAAKFLKENFRKEDIVVRLGGDEFIVVCHNHENDPVFKENLPQKISEKLTKKLIEKENNKKPEDLSLSFAFGVAVYDKDQDKGKLNNTQKRADALMYQQKQKMHAVI